MSYMKSIWENVLESILETFSGDELEEKLKATFGYTDKEIANLIGSYGRHN